MKASVFSLSPQLARVCVFMVMAMSLGCGPTEEVGTSRHGSDGPTPGQSELRSLCRSDLVEATMNRSIGVGCDGEGNPTVGDGSPVESVQFELQTVALGVGRCEGDSASGAPCQPAPIESTIGSQFVSGYLYQYPSSEGWPENAWSEVGIAEWSPEIRSTSHRQIGVVLDGRWCGVVNPAAVGQEAVLICPMADADGSS